jgi:hypothetical protein
MPIFGRNRVSGPSRQEERLVPLFTQRRKGDSTLGASSSIMWEPKAYGLDAAASAIDIGDSFVPTREDFYSVPDIFAELAVFEAALYVASHPLHKTAVTDWRATLAALLLHKELGIKVEALKLDFSQIDRSDGDSMFLHAAAEYLPSSCNSRITVWRIADDSGSMVSFALSSADYFACPAKEIASRLPNLGGIAEYRDDLRKTLFVDPCKFLQSHPAYGYRVSQVLKAAISAGACGKARSLLRDYAADIGIARYNDTKLAFGEMLLDPWLDLDIEGYGAAGKPLSVTNSDIFQERICLFDADGEYREKFPNSIGDYRVFEGDTSEERYYALMPIKAGFLEKYGFDNATGNPNQPFLNQISMRFRQDGQRKYIEARLAIDGFAYCEIYDEARWLEPVDGRKTLPPVAIWPNAIDKRGIWRAYYVFADCQGIDAIGDNWTDLRFEALVRGSDGKLQGVAGKKYTEESSVADRSQGGVNCSYSIIETASFPFILYAYSESGSQPLGAIITRPGGDEIRIANDQQAIIGIDFGTSNTVAYYSKFSVGAQPQPTPVSFAKSDVLPIISDKSLESVTTRFFMTPAELGLESSFPTLLHVSDNGALVSEIRPFRGANIYFRGSEGKQAEQLIAVPNLKTDIKWTSESDNRRWTQSFLTQLCAYCAWKVAKDGMGHIHWRFSYPSSMYNAGQFKTFLANSAQKADSIVFSQADEGVEHKHSINITTENHAAGLNFLSTTAVNPTEGFVCIDIGGGSTDISIWQFDSAGQVDRSRALAETSVKYAGKDMLTNNAIELCNDNQLSRLWDQIGVPEETRKKITAFWSENKKNVDKGILFETMLALSANAFKDKILQNNATNPLKNVIRVIAFNLSLVINLAGSLLKELISTNQFRLQRRITIMLCGNGSKMKTWLGEDGSYSKLLREVFVAASGIPQEMRVEFSMTEAPKTVVASGMVSVSGMYSKNSDVDASDDSNRDVLSARVVMDQDNRPDERMRNAAVNMLMALYPVIIREDVGLELHKYESFRDEQDIRDRINGAIAGLTASYIGKESGGVTVADAFVRYAEVLNKTLLGEIKREASLGGG